MNRPFTFLDDNGPRPMPSYLRVLPPPPPDDKILPTVPDVSLTFSPYPESGNKQKQMNYNSIPLLSSSTAWSQLHEQGQFMNQIRTSSDSDGILQELVSLVKRQSIQIQRIEEQIQKLVELNEVGKITQSEIGVQTDEPRLEPCVLISRIQTKNIPKPGPILYETQDTKRGDLTPTHTEDLSTVLRELQFPHTEQSAYSFQNSSSPQVDIPEFTDYHIEQQNKSEAESPGIGPSVSQFGSSDDEDEEIQPTVTYYRNILGNVNRFLGNPVATPQTDRNKNGHFGRENMQEDTTNTNRLNNLMIQQNVYNSIFLPNGTNKCAATEDDRDGEGIFKNRNPIQKDFVPQRNTAAPTETTMYGLSSTHLSFGTREYLERHGLVQGFRAQDIPQSNARSSNRVLDSVFKNQHL